VPETDIFLLFDLFILKPARAPSLAAGLADAPLKVDEYAAHGLLFELGPLTAIEMSRRMGMPLTTLLDCLHEAEGRGHLRRDRHPRDLPLARACSSKLQGCTMPIRRLRLRRVTPDRVTLWVTGYLPADPSRHLAGSR
jgi:hypothetical protein